MADIHDNIYNYRKLHNMTLEELGKRIGTSKQTIKRYENREIKSIPYDKIVAMANVFCISPSELMGWEEQPFQQPIRTNQNNTDDTLEFIKIDENGQISIKAKSTESLKYMVDLVDDISEENKKKIKDFIEKIYAIEQMEKEVE